MLDAGAIVDYLLSRNDPGFHCFWLEYAHGRSQLSRDIESSVGQLPILATPVESGHFTDANGITDDICEVLNANKEWFDAKRREQIVTLDRFFMVLISRRPLGLPQLASPVQLPDWFPAWPSRLLTTTINSITDLVDVGLDHESLPIAYLRTSLFALETALWRRLKRTLQQDPSKLEALWGRISGAGNSASASAEEHIRLAGLSHLSVFAPDGFRPGAAADSSFIVSKLFRLWWKVSPDGLHQLAVDLTSALSMEGQLRGARLFPLASLLMRTNTPSLQKTTDGAVFSRSMLLAIANSMQLSTACAHAGDYPRFPANLVRLYVTDVARSCEQGALFLDELYE